MNTRRFLGLPLACALGACATSSAGSAPPASDSPPRLGVPAEIPRGIVAQPSLCGLTVVGNADELHFRMELAGERVAIRQGQPNDTYLVDGLLVQVTTAGAHEIAPSARQQNGVGLLRMHATWESARRSQTLGREVEPEEIGIRTSDNLPTALVWWFASVPAEVAENKGGDAGQGSDTAAAPAAVEATRPTGIAYMTAAYGPRVLVLSVEGTRGEAKPALLAKAEALMSTVRTSADPVWATDVGAEIKAAMAAGQTCPGRANAILER